MSILKVNTIQDKGGNTLLSSDGAGTISSGGAITNTPSFSAEMDTATSITNNTWTKLECDSEKWDTNSAYDSSTNYRFTVPSGQAGKYYFQGHFHVPGVDANELGAIKFYINGVAQNQTEVREQKASADRDIYLSCVYTTNLSVGDYVELYVFQNSGDTQNADSGVFTGYKLIGA